MPIESPRAEIRGFQIRGRPFAARMDGRDPQWPDAPSPLRNRIEVDLLVQDSGRTVLKAEDIAKAAASLVSGAREKTHGDKQANFANIARLWNAWLEVRFGVSGLTGADVAKLMALLKIARMESGEFNQDDATDACGYAAIAGELGDQT